MKTDIKVTALSHDELVDILSTALDGCDYLQLNNDEEFYEAYNHIGANPDDCLEDKIAKVLLAGGTIKIVDLYAEGTAYGKGYLINEEEDGDYASAEYALSIYDFLAGCSSEEGYAYAKELLIDEEGDYYTANNLLQIIMFGEVIYG